MSCPTSDWFDRVLDEYESLRARGASIPLEALCAERPAELLRLREAVAELEAFAQVWEPGDPELGWDEPPPSEIGGYRVLQRLGGGGQGTVYLAERRDAPLKVAVKLLHGACPSEPRRRRFEQEKQLLARLQHDRIAKFYDAGLIDLGGWSAPYLVMEYVEGGPLDYYAKQRGLNLVERLRLVEETARTVHFAHAQGVVHRDLKPANLLVDRFGHVKVIDFGVACWHDAETRLTRRSAPAPGTLSYMSPEHLTAASGQLDARADVYALGVILYELVTGRSPYERAAERGEFSLMQAIIHDDPPPLTDLPRTLRRDLEAIIGKAMRKEPLGRYQSAEQLADDLNNLLTHRPIRAQTPGSWYAWQKFARRNRTLVGGIAATMMALTAGLALALIAWRDAVASRGRAERSFAQAWDYLEQTAFAPAIEGVNQPGGVDRLPAQQRQALAAMLPLGVARARALAREAPTAATNAQLARSLFGASLVTAQPRDAEQWRREANQLVQAALAENPKNMQLQTLQIWVSGMNSLQVDQAVEVLSAQELATLVEDEALLYSLAIASFNAANRRYQVQPPEELATAEQQAWQASECFRLLAERDVPWGISHSRGGVTLRYGQGLSLSLLGRIRLSQGDRSAGTQTLGEAASMLRAEALAHEDDVQVATAWCNTITVLLQTHEAAGERAAASRWAAEGSRELYTWLARHDARPEVRDVKSAVSTFYTTAIQAFVDAGQLAEARAACDEKYLLCRGLAAADPQRLNQEVEALTAKANVALVLAAENRPAEAGALLREQLAVLEGLLVRAGSENPALENYIRQNLGMGYLNLATASYLERTPESTIAAVAQAETFPLADAVEYVRVASLYAGSLQQLPDAERAERRETWEQAALQALRRAVEMGFQDAEFVAQDPELQLLKARPEFQSLVQELKQQAGKP